MQTDLSMILAVNQEEKLMWILIRGRHQEITFWSVESSPKRKGILSKDHSSRCNAISHLFYPLFPEFNKLQAYDTLVGHLVLHLQTFEPSSF